ncbi:gelsolin-like protein 2 [Liolophura sinensis]|uniref:gelsolin-like protein 2 n=1 Tax=Liolophura sinensis TaxID=3198878 RepID=UPI003157FA9E
MTGLVKQKEYDWKDSNLALFGSDTEKKVKKDAAETEPAWQKAGSRPGLKVWRIVKFEVKDWPEKDYGKFYSGDSYIVLNTYQEKDSEELLYDVHFWIGKYSTQDEYGTAAYKTVELDTFLDDKPVQHREVQGHESSLFKSYFKSITLMEGGADSGFNHVKPEEYVPRLFHVKGTKSGVICKEIPKKKEALSSDDVFILDCGTIIYQWNGKNCNWNEKLKACQEIVKMREERSGKAIRSETLDEDDIDEDDEFHSYFNGDSQEVNENGTEEQQKEEKQEKQLYRLSDNGGQCEFSLEKTGRINRTDFESKDVFLLDTQSELIVWIGKSASKDEQKNAMSYAHMYLQSSPHPLIPVACLREGMKSRQFELAVPA